MYLVSCYLIFCNTFQDLVDGKNVKQQKKMKLIVVLWDNLYVYSFYCTNKKIDKIWEYYSF